MTEAAPRAGAGAVARLTLVVAVCATAGCAARIPLPQSADAVAAQGSWPGTTTTDLSRGRSLYVVRCGSCHVAHVPADRKPPEWPAIVDKMTERAKLSGPEKTDILRYLSVMSEPH